jgi:hypothetical protein
MKLQLYSNLNDTHFKKVFVNYVKFPSVIFTPEDLLNFQHNLNITYKHFTCFLLLLFANILSFLTRPQFTQNIFSCLFWCLWKMIRAHIFLNYLLCYQILKGSDDGV